MRREDLLAAWFALKRHADRARCLDDERARSVLHATLGTIDVELVARSLERRGALLRDQAEESGEEAIWMVGSGALFEESSAVFGDNCNVMNEVAA